MTTEPPEDLGKFYSQLLFYLNKSYTKQIKEKMLAILQGGSCTITKTGNWGEKFGYAEAKVTFFVNGSVIEQVDPAVKRELKEISEKMLQAFSSALEIIEVDFVQKVDMLEPSTEDELISIAQEIGSVSKEISIPEDIIRKGKEMSEAYLYVYFVENYLRGFIQHVIGSQGLQFPSEVVKTISKNKASEGQSKFLPLRGDSDLFYCDFVQLQQIITNNWEVFKSFFPQQDQHWLRVKIEDMYRVRNLIAHCGYITATDLQMVKTNFRMIVNQLRV